MTKSATKPVKNKQTNKQTKVNVEELRSDMRLSVLEVDSCVIPPAECFQKNLIQTYEAVFIFTITFLFVYMEKWSSACYMNKLELILIWVRIQRHDSVATEEKQK